MQDAAVAKSTETAAPLISCKGLTKVYIMGGQKLNALDNVDIEIQQGEFVAIMGPSGSGKSTLLNMMGALDTPTSGEFNIGGKNIAEMSPDQLAELRNREIGFVFQQFNLLRRTTALENVKLPLVYGSGRGIDANAAAQKRLEEVGLGSRIDHTSAQLSGGQQQRVAIARALVTDPRIILADEPTGALDTETSIEIMKLFTDLNKKGLTIILVTHEAEIAEYADRLLSFRDGKLIKDSQNMKAEAS
ncbi:MAG: ABC transporter ATP-binding protein [Methyloligellaceae bacterium]